MKNSMKIDFLYKHFLQQDLRKEVTGLIPGFIQYYYRGLMTVIGTGFIPLHCCGLKWLCGKAASGFERILS